MSGNGATTDFSLVERGYDPNQVDKYVATQMLQLREQLDAAAHRIVALEDDLQSAHDREDAIQLTMVAATKARDELLSNAKQEAEVMVADARRVAFVLMTESRTDADAAIAEGKVIVDVARTEALSLMREAKEETKRMVAERRATLAKLQADYEAESAILIERIQTLRRMADDLTARAAAPQPPATSQDVPSPPEGRTVETSQTGDVPDHEEDGDAPIADRIRGSFSGRRTAKLPRLGEEAGRSALAVATAMRTHLDHGSGDSAAAEESDLAVRTA